MLHMPTLTSVAVDSNPNMSESENMDNWRCVLHYEGRRMIIYYSKGVGHNGAEPTVYEVLSCLASDASACGMSFEEFCSECGYDSDSRKAERTYKACQRQGAALRRLLGANYDAVTQAAQEFDF